MILGSGGAVDIQTGRPPNHPDREMKARKRLNTAISEAVDIANELHGGSPILQIFLQSYRDRMVFLAGNDPECQVLKKTIANLRFKLEFAPILAEREALKVLGPQLSMILDSTDAPEGIPSE